LPCGAKAESLPLIPKPKGYPMNKITLPFLKYTQQVDIHILQSIIDKVGYIDIISLYEDQDKSIFIYLKIKTLEKHKWVQPIGATTIITLDNTEYVFLGFLGEIGFKNEIDIIRNLIATQKNSMLAGKLVPVPAQDDKRSDFYFEWNEPETI
jgi:hypothetical protein